MSKKKTAADRRNPQHAPALLLEMCRASQQGLAPGEWLKLSERKRHAELRAAMERYAPKSLTARSFGHALRALVDQRFEHEGEVLMCRSRYVNREHTTRYGVAGTLRERILQKRATAEQREAQIQGTAHELAKELRRNADPVAAIKAVLPTIAAESAADRSRREAIEETRRAGWLPGHFSPLNAKPDAPAIEPTVAPSTTPAAAPEPAPVDMTEWPPAWRKFGKPSYATPVREAPDDSFNSALFAKGGSKMPRDQPPDCYPRSPLPK